MDNFVADQIYVDAPPEAVFRALLEPEDVLLWMEGREACIGAGDGGEFSVVRLDGSIVAGRIASFEAGVGFRLVDYHWEQGDVRRGPMTLTARVTPEDDGAWLFLRQDGLDSGPDWQSFAAETRRELVRATVTIKRHVEGI